jgi:hypothetical protein
LVPEVVEVVEQVLPEQQVLPDLLVQQGIQVIQVILEELEQAVLPVLAGFFSHRNLPLAEHSMFLQE